ncbi:MAG: hypothetical protein ABRQ38_21910 [Candidatus Eremiobacterota bacterium]
MSSSKNMLFISCILLILFIAVGCGDDTAKTIVLPTSTPSTGDVNTFIANLEQNGFIVQEGEFNRADLIKLCEEGKSPNCNANNYNTPYFTCDMPKSPGQTVNDYMTDPNGCSKGFRMRADEAIIITGKTPPEMLFFNYPLFLHTRQNSFYSSKGKTLTESSVYPVVSGSGEYARRILFGGLGDTVNIASINTSGTPGGAPGNPCNQQFMIIVTPDRNTDANIRSLAQKSGYPETILNTEVVPSSVVKLGITEDADSLGIGNRNAMFVDEGACEAYIANPPVRVFRVTPSVQGQLNPFDTPVMRTRGNGITEMDYLPSLNKLRKAILNKYKDYKAQELTTDIWLNESYEAIQMGLDNLGESRDTTYLGTNNDPDIANPVTLPDDPNSFFIVYGVNHVKTGKCTYSNFVIYGSIMINGVIGVDSRQFAGSASDYMPDDAGADYLYAWKVARQANGDTHCVEVPFPETSGDLHGIGAEEPVFIGFRAYLEPGQKVGPVWHELVYDRVIKFSK